MTQPIPVIETRRPKKSNVTAIAFFLALLTLFVLALGLRLDAARRPLVEPNDQYVFLGKVLRSMDNNDPAPPVASEDDLLRKPPVLPYLMKVFPRWQTWLIIQAFLSAFLLFPLFLLGLRWGGKVVGLAGAMLWTAWGPAIELCRTIHQETLFALFLVIALLLYDCARSRYRVGIVFAAALVFSLAELTRPVLAPFVALLSAALFLRAVTHRFALKWLLPAVAMVVGFAAPIGLYHWSRAQEGMTWVYDRKGVTMLTPLVENGEVDNYLSKHVPDNWFSLDGPTRERFVMNLFWQQVKEKPFFYVTQALTRIGQFWTGNFGKWETSWLQANPWLLLLAVFGMVWVYRQNRTAFILSLFLWLNFSLMAAVIFAKPRFREVVTAWFLVLVGAGIVQLVFWLGTRLGWREAS